MIGALLVLLTWALLIGVWMIAGAVATSPRITKDAGNPRTRLRRSMWWGLALFTLAVLTVGIRFPLGSAAAVIGVVAILAPVAAIGAVSLLRHASRNRRGRERAIARSRRLLLGALAIATVYLAWAALGPVTNYDTGLYHLGAIRYAAEYPTITGLANLYFPFGYNNAQFPLAAFLGNGPWGGEGYRLLNGLLFAGLVTDLILRARSSSWGTYVLMVGAVVVAVPMVALEDYWVTSPTSDSSVFILTIVAVAYLADGLAKATHAPSKAGADLLVALMLAVLTVTLRPLMAVFAAAMLAVVAYAQLSRSRRSSRPHLPGRAWALWAGLAAALAVVQSARDYLLSGWLQYPLSLWSFDVPWGSPDPVWNRTPTLGAARDPSDLWAATEGYGWVGAWLGRLPSQWEAYLLVLLLVVVAAALFPIRGQIRVRALVLALIPVIAVDLLWFLVSPPSFRFAWGPLFAVGILPLGAALQAWRRAPTPVPTLASVTITAASLAVLAVTVVTALWRSDPQTRTSAIEWRLANISLSLPATPIADAPVTERTLPSGLTVVVPTESDQCWANYPLCTAQLEPTVSLRGADISDGFAP